MPDITDSVIIATLASAFGIFTISSAFRKRSFPSGIADAPDLDVPTADGLDVCGPPTKSEMPSPLPQPGVSTAIYNRMDLLGIAFIFVLFSYLVLSSGEGTAALNRGMVVTAIVFQFVSALIVSTFVLVRLNPIQWLGLKWSDWKMVFLIAPGAVIGMWLIVGLLQLVGYMTWVESLGVETVQDTVKLFQDSNDRSLLILMSVMAIVAAPICEEIIFRGYLYPAAKKFAGPWVAGICSALVFGAAHGSLAALLPLFIFGCVLAFAYERTGSIWSTIAIHCCFNAATVIVQTSSR